MSEADEPGRIGLCDAEVLGSSRIDTRAEIGRRAGAGAVIVASRAVVTAILALVGNVVLARLLLPEDFGTVAVGMSVVLVARFFADAGIGANLVRRKEPVQRIDLETLLGVQLLVTLGLAGLVAAPATQWGTAAQVTALMVASLPITALQSPAAVICERQLSYRPLALAEVTESLVHYGWAIGTVAIGWGVWGLASAVVVRAIAGTTVLFLRTETRVLRPRLSWRRIRSLLPFGVRYQLFGLALLARDQVLNIGAAAIGGLALLGVWVIARRFLQIPFLLFTSLWRVSFPAMSRLVNAGEPPGPVIERSVELAAVATGLLLAPLVGAGPALVPAVLGDSWAGSADVLPWAGLGLMIGGPVSVATAGYLWAVGDATTPLRAVACHGVAWVAVTFTLMPAIGVTALGVGWLAASLVDALVLARGARRKAEIRLLPALRAPVAVAALSAAGGWLVSSDAGATLASALLCAGLSEALYLTGLCLLCRRSLAETFAVTGRAIRASLASA
jgi:O-antigen/teichoic acid export membrane protein